MTERVFTELNISASELRPFFQKNSLYLTLKLALIIALWLILGWLIISTHILYLKIGLWLCLGFIMNGLIQLVHDAWHGNLFQTRLANRLFGHALSMVFPILYEPARHGHMLHHRYNRTVNDPDAYNAGKRSTGLVILYYVVILFGLPLAIIHFNLLYPLKYFSGRKLLIHFLSLSLLTSYYIAIIMAIQHFQLTEIALTCWLIPFLFTSPWNGLKSVSDHYENEWNGSQFRTATTVYSNRFLTYFWNGLNYHLDHHLFPAVPGYHLPKLHKKIQSGLVTHQAPIFHSYFITWWHALMKGPVFVDDEVGFLSLKRKDNKI